MELTILHLCPDLMGLYGEYANLSVLRRCLEKLGVSVEVKTASPGDKPDLAGADLIYMGAGTERSQKAALTALTPFREELMAARDRGAVLLFTGNAMEILGQSVTDASGKTWPGLGLAPYTTAESEKRVPGDVIAESVLWDEPTVGFMNKCSTTSGSDSPLFKSLTLGFGNEAEHGSEGYVSGNLFATHLTGPVLVRNPAFLELILRRLFEAKGWPVPDALPVLPHQREAYAVTLKELSQRIGK